MLNYLATLLGALIGSIGAVFTQFWLSGRAKDKQTRKLVAWKYLYQLQDAAEALWFRVDNLAVFHAEIKDGSYFEYTTLYAFGCVLTSERVLGLDGVYPLLNDTYPGPSDVFRNRIDNNSMGFAALQER